MAGASETKENSPAVYFAVRKGMNRKENSWKNRLIYFFRGLQVRI